MFDVSEPLATEWPDKVCEESKRAAFIQCEQAEILSRETGEARFGEGRERWPK